MRRRYKPAFPEQDAAAGPCADHFAMLDLIAEFVAMDGRDCAIDQVGECRPHAYPAVETGGVCPYQEAKGLLEAHAPELQQRDQERSAAARQQLEQLLDVFSDQAGGRR